MTISPRAMVPGIRSLISFNLRYQPEDLETDPNLKEREKSRGGVYQKAKFARQP